MQAPPSTSSVLRCCPSWQCSPASILCVRSAMAETIYIKHDDDGIRLDRWFKRHYPALTHGRLEKLLRTGQVRLDGKRTKAADRIAAGQRLRLPPQVIHDRIIHDKA